MYADDIQLYSRFNLQSIDSEVDRVNIQLDSIDKWCQGNGLSINPAKTQAMIIGPRTPTQECADSLPKLMLRDTPIRYNQAGLKNLGVLFDPQLSWRRHAEKISMRIHFGLRSLYPLAAYIPRNLKIFLVKTLLVPHLLYASNVTFPLKSAALNTLSRALNSCVRFAFGLRRVDSVSPFTAILLGGPLQDFLKIRAIELIFKLKAGMLPGYLRDLVTWSSLNPYRINMPFCHLAFGSRSAILESCRCWNDLPEHVRRMPSLREFRKEVHRHLGFNQD